MAKSSTSNRKLTKKLTNKHHEYYLLQRASSKGRINKIEEKMFCLTCYQAYFIYTEIILDENCVTNSYIPSPIASSNGDELEDITVMVMFIWDPLFRKYIQSCKIRGEIIKQPIIY